MPKDRSRERRGAHASIAGVAADEVLDTLIAQFSDPYAFVRELIQNSLDAGASRIDIAMDYADGELVVSVRDDGEGMDLETIEGYLLVKFRSTKEQDLTKIGKFGIGFVSLFAMKPREVVVDTGRDAIWHRVVFAEDRSYTLFRMDDPFEGTTVTLKLPRKRDRASEDCARIHDSAVRWCRFADGEITTSARGVRDGWDDRVVRAPFMVDSPVVVEERGDAFHAVCGVHPSERAPVGFYNRGLTLWETDEPFVPGVTFRVHGRHLEHTLTRDNVIRDEHFDRVLRRIEDLARTKLRDAVHAEAIVAADGDLDRVRRLFAAIAPRAAFDWRGDAPILPGHGGPLSLVRLGSGGGLLKGLFGRPELLWATPGCPLGAALARAGRAVLAAASADDAHVRWVSETLGSPAVAATDRWFVTEPCPSDPWSAAFGEALAERWRMLGRGDLEVLPARFADRGNALAGRFAIRQREPFTVQPSASARDRDGTLLVAVDHPLWEKLRRLDPALAAMLGAVAIHSELSIPLSVDGAAESMIARVRGAPEPA